MPLNRSRVIAFAATAIAGCSLLRPFEKPVQTGTADMFVDEASFDGRELTARVLIRVRGGDLSIQQHLRALNGLTVEEVTDCDTGARVPFIQFVVVSFEDDPLVQVPDGHWYGVDTVFPVYAEEFVGDKPAPDCIVATIYWSIPTGDENTSRWVSAKVRAVTKRPEAPDSGAPPPADADAGTDLDSGHPPGPLDAG